MSKLQNQYETPSEERAFFERPAVGTALTILSGLAFLFVCMILPIVAKAAKDTVHLRQNTLAFVSALALCLVLAGLATWSKMKRRAVDQSPLPVFSMVLCTLSLLLLLALSTGLLRI